MQQQEIAAIGDRNVYSINPLTADVASWPGSVPVSVSVCGIPGLTRHSPFKTSRRNFLVRARHRFLLAWPGQLR